MANLSQWWEVRSNIIMSNRLLAVTMLWYDSLLMMTDAHDVLFESWTVTHCTCSTQQYVVWLSICSSGTSTLVTSICKTMGTPLSVQEWSWSSTVFKQDANSCVQHLGLLGLKESSHLLFLSRSLWLPKCDAFTLWITSASLATQVYHRILCCCWTSHAYCSQHVTKSHPSRVMLCSSITHYPLMLRAMLWLVGQGLIEQISYLLAKGR